MYEIMNITSRLDYLQNLPDVEYYLALYLDWI